VPYVSINTSQDMLDLLAYLKQECRQPADQRQYRPIVIDTLDAFQRKVKNEWMEKEKKEVFTGWEAWGFLNSKMQLLMTRLLNLDMNVIVNVHYKDKTTKDDETGKRDPHSCPSCRARPPTPPSTTSTWSAGWAPTGPPSTASASRSAADLQAHPGQAVPQGPPARHPEVAGGRVRRQRLHQPVPDPKPAPSKARVDEAAEALKRMTHGPDPIANPARVKQVPEGLVNTETGELEATPEQAVETVKEVLGATVISEPTPPAPTPPAAPPAVVEPLTCAECGKDLTDENPDIVKLSYIRFRKRLCETHYAEAKAKR
jgi:hypothetical protein